MDIQDYAFRLGLAIALGAAVGIERQWRQKSAGLRTNTLVSLGSAAFMLLSYALTDGSTDHSRVAAQIVTGIGFLGAGVIMRNGMTVQGLNTAATIWCSAAVGSLAGSGMYGEAAVTAAAIIASHLVLRPLGKILSKTSFVKTGDTPTDYLLTIKCRQDMESSLRVMLIQSMTKDDNLLLRSLTSSEAGDPGTKLIVAEITSNGEQDNRMEKLAGKLTVDSNVMKVKWELIGQENEL